MSKLTLKLTPAQRVVAQQLLKDAEEVKSPVELWICSEEEWQEWCQLREQDATTTNKDKDKRP